MKKALLLLLAFAGVNLTAQTIDNLNLFNTTGLHGSPRYMAMGGAFTALGNDFSAIHLNPAGASVYRQSNLGFTLGFQNQSDQTRFLGSRGDYSNFNVLFENIGLVKKFGRNNGVTFSLTYNKMADFNNQYTVMGVNRYDPSAPSGYTLGEYWLAGAYNLTISQMEDRGMFEEASATNATVLLADSLGAYIYDYYPDDASDVTYFFEENGGRDEFQFSLGGQAKDRFHYAFSVGVPSLRYGQFSELTESGFADSSYISNYTLRQSNEVYGTGINFKVGFIGKPVQWLRVGASYQSPSWYTVNEISSLDVRGYSAADGITYQGTEYIFDDTRYMFRTSSILRAGAALVMARALVFSVDYEYRDPSNSEVKARDGKDYRDAQNLYKDLTTATSTLKAGVELRLGGTYWRGGYQYSQSNFQDANFFYSERTYYTTGFGYKNADFSIDLGFVWGEYTVSKSTHPYLGDNLDGQGVVNPERTLVKDDVTKANFVIGASFSL